MATSNIKVFSKNMQDKLNIEINRSVFLMNCRTGNPTPNEKLSANYIVELNERVKYLESRIKEINND